MMRKIEVNIRQFIFAINGCFKPTTYDYVIYKNRKYYIKPSFTGNDIWALHDLENTIQFNYIKGSDLKIFHSIKRFIQVFKSNINFQKSSWEAIDLRNPIGTRLSYINSDNIKF